MQVFLILFWLFHWNILELFYNWHWSVFFDIKQNAFQKLYHSIIPNWKLFSSIHHRARVAWNIRMVLFLLLIAYYKKWTSSLYSCHPIFLLQIGSIYPSNPKNLVTFLTNKTNTGIFIFKLEEGLAGKAM